MAGPAIALSYGLLGAGILLVVGLLLVRVAPRRRLIQITLAIVLALVGFIAWRLLAYQGRAGEVELQRSPVPTQLVEPVNALARMDRSVGEDRLVGMGMVSPASNPGGWLYMGGSAGITMGACWSDTTF